MKKLKVFYILIISVLVSGCIFPVKYTQVFGSRNIVTEPRHVFGFDSVELSGIGTLIVEQGSKESLTVTAEDNILKHLNSDVHRGNLRLGVEDLVSIEPTKEIVYHLTVKNLRRIELSGLGNVEIEALNTSGMEIDVSGSGNVYIGDLQAESLHLDISGLGNVEIGGDVEDQRIGLSGAGNYNAENLKKLSTLKKLRIPIILMDAPYRLTRLLSEVIEVFGKACLITLAFDLTLATEKVLHGSIEHILKKIIDKKGEFILIVHP